MGGLDNGNMFSDFLGKVLLWWVLSKAVRTNMSHALSQFVEICLQMVGAPWFLCLYGYGKAGMSYLNDFILTYGTYNDLLKSYFPSYRGMDFNAHCFLGT